SGPQGCAAGAFARAFGAAGGQHKNAAANSANAKIKTARFFIRRNPVEKRRPARLLFSTGWARPYRETSSMDSYERRAAARRATWSAFVARSAAGAAARERISDASIPPVQRVEMIWQLVLRTPGVEHASQPRLDRSVGRVERRRR
ncbi:MAG TPA: hypothetical protein VJP76_05695, partial [Candidatus Tumulicola sp.]|nr:hypothetical protein [Candidatus Tumulicola sp.]